jgi:hypothetical protein
VAAAAHPPPGLASHEANDAIFRMDDQDLQPADGDEGAGASSTEMEGEEGATDLQGYNSCTKEVLRHLDSRIDDPHMENR